MPNTGFWYTLVRLSVPVSCQRFRGILQRYINSNPHITANFCSLCTAGARQATCRAPRVPYLRRGAVTEVRPECPRYYPQEAPASHRFDLGQTRHICAIMLAIVSLSTGFMGGITDIARNLRTSCGETDGLVVFRTLCRCSARTIG